MTEKWSLKMFLDWLIYAGVRLALLLIGIMPRFLAYPFCEGLAMLVWFLDRKHQRIAMVNLTIAFPEKDEQWKKQVFRRSFLQLGDQVVELSRMNRLTRQEVLKRVRYEEGGGLEHYLKVHQQNRPVLFLTAHISAWELLPTVHAFYGHPLSFVVRPLDNPFLERWATRLRTRAGNRVLSKRQSVRQILKTLKEGGDVGFLVDQNSQEKEGVYVPFFGHTASTNSSLAALALKTSSPIVPGFIYPDHRRGHYVIRFYPAVELVKSDDPQKDVREGMALLNRFIEEVIREYPHCWLWGHRRFRTQPDGRDLYHFMV
ncbi:lysophospholipid acyltransferase family protein [Acidobacteria bacterium AH-259-D05]|nr:lysophospholipid acyltransferase family protein [Acidobacteria bacterium AH-259-D05]